ncbi:hypothetical protein CAEBREN_07305 [Caenorhabditis brenneri]|uniref:SET domain-containing protein n=1 Tax=Caenorhabditis brenneri TaxID=135651 RepID=G0NUD2_CAEBE|nr:hypothetical protein CAEBREN_07305 [Caenorhabditis brenneri]
MSLAKFTVNIGTLIASFNWKVFQGGLSPADLRVVLVATKAIKSGDELTWNYGGAYVKHHLGICLCEKCKQERSSRKRKTEDSFNSSQAKKQCDHLVFLFP